MLLLFRRCFRRVYASRYTKRWTSHYSVGFSYKGEGEKRGVTFRAVPFLLCIFVFNQFAVTLRKYLGREILNTDNILSLLSFGVKVRLFLNFLSHQRKL